MGALRDELVRGRSPRLRRRRALIVIAALAAVDAIVVGLRQTGVLRRLPEPPGRIWDSNGIVTSRAAYVLGVPDAPLGALGFVTVMVLASRLGDARRGRRPLVALALFGTASVAAAGAALYLRDMIFDKKRLCPYCLFTAASSFALVALAAPELSRPR
jgi:uncharacterized membrane protein